MNSPKNVRSLARILALGLIVSVSGVAQAQLAGDPTANSTKPVVGILNPGPGVVGVPFRVQVKVFSPLNQAVTSVSVAYTGPTSGTLPLVKNGNYTGSNAESGVWQEIFTSARLNVGGTYTLIASATNGGGTVSSSPVVVTVNNSGDGNLLVRDNGDQFCSDCHLHKTHSSEFTGATNYGSWYVGCRTCHTPHNTPNASLISPQINPPDVTAAAALLPAKQVVFSNRRGYSATGGATSAASGTYANGDETGVCQVCHTRTQYYRYDGNDYPAPTYTATPSGGHYPSQAGGCGSCHKHDAGMKASCTSCHGSATNAAPPVVAPATVVFVPGGGVHQQHLTQTNFRTTALRCTDCHTTADTTHPSGGTSVSWGTVAIGDGSVTMDPPTGNITGTWAGTPSCTNWCHGGSLIDGLPATKDPVSWNVPATLDCGSCHGFVPDVAPHTATMTTSANGCDGCHPAGYNPVTGVVPAEHIDGTVQAQGCTGCHGTVGGTGAPPVVAFNPAVPVGKVTNGGVHTSHLENTSYRQNALTCGDCHSGFDPAAIAHKNGFVTVAWSPLASTGFTPTPAAGSLTLGFESDPGCTNYCHGATLNTVAPRPSWAGPAFGATCQQCHASPPAITGNHPQNNNCDSCHAYAGNTGYSLATFTVTGNAKQSHIDATTQKPANGCRACHGSLSNTYAGPADPAAAPGYVQGVSVDSSGDTAVTARGVGQHNAHVTGLNYRLATIACTECHSGAAMPTDLNVSHANGTVALAAGALTLDNTLGNAGSPQALTFNGTTCANTYCHGNFAGGKNATPSWTTVSSLDCNSCHGSGTGATATYPTGGHIARNDCATCHPDYTVAANRGSHINGQLDYVAGGLDCNTCHGGSLTPAVSIGNDVNAQNLILDAPPTDSTGATTGTKVGAHDQHANLGAAAPVLSNAMACTLCHGTVPTTNAVSGTHRDGLPTVPFSGIALASGAAYSGGSCASTYCHGNFEGGRKISIAWGNGTDNKQGCATCHLSPPIPKAADTTPVSYHPNNTDCVGCHGTGYSSTTVAASTHVDGTPTLVAARTGCVACHGTPGTVRNDTTNSDPNVPAAYVATGVHAAHVNPATATKISNPIHCTECHGADKVSKTDHANGNSTPDFLSASVLADIGNTPTYVGGNCTNYCHGATRAGGGAPNGGTGLKVTPSWTGTLTGCATCHGLPPNTAGHSTVLVKNDATECVTCHVESVNADGTIKFDVNGVTTHINGILNGGACNGCHGNRGTARTPVAGADAMLDNAPPTAADTVTSATTADQVGAHLSHVNQLTLRDSALLCSECHGATLPVHPGTGLANITWGSLATTGLAPTTPTYTRGTGCASTYCHGNFTNGNDQVTASIPGAPGTPTFSAVANNTLTVSWTAAAGATIYKVERAPDSAGAPGTWAQIATTTGTSYTDGGIWEATPYWYRVRAWSSAGDGAYSANASQTTTGGTVGAYTATDFDMVANAATNLGADGTTTVTALGDLVPDQAGGLGPMALTTQNFTYSGTTRYRIQPALTMVSGTTYSYAALYSPALTAANRAVNAGVSARIDSYVRTTGGVDPWTVTLYEYTSGGSSILRGSCTVLPNWAVTTQQTSTCTLNNLAFAADVGSRLKVTVKIVATASSGRISALWGQTASATPSGQIFFTAGLASFTAPGLPAVPTGTTTLTMGAVTSTTVAMTWTAVSGATSYVVERGLGASPATWTQVGRPTGLSFTDQGLTASTLYSYRVKAASAGGVNATASTARQATTSAPGAAGATSWTGTFTPGSSTMTCSSCHGSPPGGTHPPGANCTTCHETYTATTVDKAIHMDGNIDKPTDCTACHVSAMGTRREIVSEFSMTWSHKRSAGGVVTKWDCIVCHMEGDPATGLPLDGTSHKNGNINLRDPDTGLEITNVTFTGALGGTAAGSYGPAAGNPVIADFSRNLGAALESDPQKAQLQAIQQNMCLKCHDSGGAAMYTTGPAALVAFGTARGFTASKPFGTTISYSAIAANLGGTATPPSGAQTAGGVAGGVIDVATSFLTSNSSYHPVSGRNNNSYATGTRMKAPFNTGITRTAGAVNVFGYLLSCWDCHALPTDSGTITRSVTAHGGSATLRGTATTTGNPPTAAAAVTLCNKCHALYDSCGSTTPGACGTDAAPGTTPTSHGAGSAFSSDPGRSEKLDFLAYGCNKCHASSYTTPVVRPERAVDTHGTNVLPTAGTKTGLWLSSGRPYAFIRNTQMYSSHQPAKIGATTYTPTCVHLNDGVCTSRTQTYTVGGTF